MNKNTIAAIHRGVFKSGMNAIDLTRKDIEYANEIAAHCEANSEKAVAMFSEEEIPTFRQGAPKHELEDYVTAEICTALVQKIEEQKKQLKAQSKGMKEQARLLFAVPTAFRGAVISALTEVQLRRKASKQEEDGPSTTQIIKDMLAEIKG